MTTDDAVPTASEERSPTPTKETKMECKLILTAALNKGDTESSESLTLRFDDLDDLVFRLWEMCDGGQGFWPYTQIIPFADRLGCRVRRARGAEKS
jgi:hypothetical protein